MDAPRIRTVGIYLEGYKKGPSENRDRLNHPSPPTNTKLVGDTSAP